MREALTTHGHVPPQAVNGFVVCACDVMRHAMLDLVVAEVAKATGSSGRRGDNGTSSSDRKRGVVVGSTGADVSVTQVESTVSAWCDNRRSRTAVPPRPHNSAAASTSTRPEKANISNDDDGDAPFIVGVSLLRRWIVEPESQSWGAYMSSFAAAPLRAWTSSLLSAETAPYMVSLSAEQGPCVNNVCAIEISVLLR